MISGTHCPSNPEPAGTKTPTGDPAGATRKLVAVTLTPRGAARPRPPRPRGPIPRAAGPAKAIPGAPINPGAPISPDLTTAPAGPTMAAPELMATGPRMLALATARATKKTIGLWEIERNEKRS